MKEFLHIRAEGMDIYNEESFIADVVGLSSEDVQKDMELYNGTLDDLEFETIKDGSKLLDKQNRPSLLAMVAYSYKEDTDINDWLEKYAKENNMYLADQKRNYVHMKKDFERFCLAKSRIIA